MKPTVINDEIQAAIARLVATERERILAIARKYGAVVPVDDTSRAKWASFASLVETLDAKEGPPDVTTTSA